jgi:hypothetical protein
MLRLSAMIGFLVFLNFASGANALNLAKAGTTVVLVGDRIDQWTALPPSRV